MLDYRTANFRPSLVSDLASTVTESKFFASIPFGFAIRNRADD
jgi:hypothetical protein